MTNLTSSLHTHFGFDAFRAGHKRRQFNRSSTNATPSLSCRRAQASFSSFNLSALQLNGLTLVISPLIALMKDQVDSLTRRNIPATYINSALPVSEQNLRLQNLSQNKYRLVYVAPKRLRNVQFLSTLKTQTISLLAVDEAHCISEWGYDFRPDYLLMSPTRAVILGIHSPPR